MEVTGVYCGNHFTIYVNKTIMLYVLNLYTDGCEIFLNKTGKKITKKENLTSIIQRHRNIYTQIYAYIQKHIHKYLCIHTLYN